MVLEKTLESPLDCKGIQPVHPKGNQSWVFIESTDVEAEIPILWNLGSTAVNKVCGGDGIPAVLLKILKEDDSKALQSICQQIWKSQQWPQDWKMSTLISIPKKG